MSIEAILFAVLWALDLLLQWIKLGKPLTTWQKALYGRVMFKCIRATEYGQMQQIEPVETPAPEEGDVQLMSAKAPPATVAEMRTQLAADWDRLLGLPRFILQADERARVYKMQAYWATAPDEEVAKLL